MSELGSATVQGWARRTKEKTARIDAEMDRIDADCERLLRNLHPKPWLREAIRKWWSETWLGWRD